jgi:hypothetical protein
MTRSTRMQAMRSFAFGAVAAIAVAHLYLYEAVAAFWHARLPFRSAETSIAIELAAAAGITLAFIAREWSGRSVQRVLLSAAIVFLIVAIKHGLNALGIITAP